MILTVTWAKEQKLIGANTVWYKERWERGMLLKNNKVKLVLPGIFNSIYGKLRQQEDPT